MSKVQMNVLAMLLIVQLVVGLGGGNLLYADQRVEDLPPVSAPPESDVDHLREVIETAPLLLREIPPAERDEFIDSLFAPLAPPSEPPVDPVRDDVGDLPRIDD